ncbi:sigma-70 family RNA polymerase sigma factor, partial [Aeromonas veronii]
MNKAQAYLRHQDSYVLVERHAPLVKRIAQHLLARLPSSVLLDDLIQAGMIGLLEASRNFDGSKGASFETYAGIRIRGAMLDEIRRGDWVPRSVHRNSRAIAEAIENVE